MCSSAETWAPLHSAERYGLDADEVLLGRLCGRRPVETSRRSLRRACPRCRVALQRTGRRDARSGVVAAFNGARGLLHILPPRSEDAGVLGLWAPGGGFLRTSLPAPGRVIVDVSGVEEGRPSRP